MLLLSGALAQAQTTRIWPSRYKYVSGETPQATPFTISPNHQSRQTRNMTLINPGSLSFKKGTSLSGIAFRREGESDMTYQAQTGGTLRVTLGESSRTELSMSHSFRNNLPKTPTTVFNTSLNLPKVTPGTGWPPPPFTIQINFTKPYAYNGGSLVIDLLYNNSSAISDWYRDGDTMDRGDLLGRSASIGRGCTGSNGYRPYTYGIPGTALPGRELMIYMYGAVVPGKPEEKYAFNILGYTDKNFGPLPLPFDLSLVGMGSGCKLYQNIFFLDIITLDTTSPKYARGYALYDVPASPLFTGATLFTQWICNDSQVGSSMKFTVSNGAEIFLGEPGKTPGYGQTLWLYGAKGDARDVGETSPGKDFIPIIRFSGTFV